MLATMVIYFFAFTLISSSLFAHGGELSIGVLELNELDYYQSTNCITSPLVASLVEVETEGGKERYRTPEEGHSLCLNVDDPELGSQSESVSNPAGDNELRELSLNERTRLEKFWDAPSDLLEEISATVQVKLKPDGTVDLVSIANTSGSVQFDKSVLEAVYKDGKFNSSPTDFMLKFNYKPQ